VAFLIDKELSLPVGFLFGISGFWSIKIGLGFFGIPGKFSVIRGKFGCSLLSNQFLPARIGPTSLFGS